MPRWQSVLNARLNKYEEYLRQRRRDPETIAEYRRLIEQALVALNDAGLETCPSRIGTDEVAFVYNEVYGHLSPHSARLQLSIFGTWLKRMAENPVVENMCLEWPEDLRINAKWLEPTLSLKLRNAAIGMERILVHCELDCLMRRCEVLRLRPSDFKGGQIDINGKGKLGGKGRSIPYHPRTLAEVGYWRELREAMIEEAFRRSPAVEVPDAIAIYRKGARMVAYQRTGLDKMIKRVAQRAGIDEHLVSNHVLRRSGAKLQWLAGTPIASIMKTLGHKTEEQTIKYLGLNLNDMSEGMQKAERYLEALGESGTYGTKPAR